MRDDDQTPLRALAEMRGMPIGAAVDLVALDAEPHYRAMLHREFNMCMAAEAFQQPLIWIGPYEYDFGGPDRLAAFTRENGMLLRGHALLWHQAVPVWLRSGGFTPRSLRDMLRAYIHAFVGRYRGRVCQWDVVTEAVMDGVPELRRESFWYKALGPDYIGQAFTWAGEADPGAHLYYNDYGAEDMGPKADVVYRLVRRLQAAGIPIHGVGLQCHFENGWRITEEHRTNVRRLENLGLDWQVTGCDIRLQVDAFGPTSEQLAEQACGYDDLVRLCLAGSRCRGFTVWGVTDRHSWGSRFRAGRGAALSFNADYLSKPAYDAIAAALWDPI